ncbi:V-type ATPase 116kDa subunit family protein [Amphritea sp. HPY]|uniref:V-type ATPase 116kDa subunit family protein n=1 Tax=Amphritea sp. HPY TaxID=3421652 RepID=UPI003D7E0C86
MFFPEDMTRLIWIVSKERLATCLQQLSETEAFQPIDHHSLGEEEDLQALKLLLQAKQRYQRFRAAGQLLEGLPEEPLLSYKIGTLSGSTSLPQGAVQIDSELFLWVGSKPPADLKPPPPPLDQPPLALTEHQSRLLLATADQVGHVEGWSIIDGWIPSKKMEIFGELLRHECIALTPAEDSGLSLARVPSLFRRHKALEGFAALMGLYGITGYRELDPTPLLTISFSLMFGMMFADLGQGLLLSLLGFWLFSQRWPSSHSTTRHQAGLLLIPIGLSAAVFGILFGNLFAREDWIPALIYHPMDEVYVSLAISVIFGIGVLCISMFIGLLNAWLSGHLKERLWDNFGLIGLLFYLALIGLTLGYWAQWTGLKYLCLTLASAGLITMALRNFALMEQEPIGLRLFATLVETYDFAIKFVVHTLSFVRLAAFTFAHIALSMALVIIVELLSGHSWLALSIFVLGNIIITVIEGFLVCIQVIRLHFYELFTKFISGGGIPFEPLRLSVEHFDEYADIGQ